MASVCRDCGEQVTWARTKCGGTHPPLNYLGVVYVINDGVVVERAGYERHECDPAKVEVWQNSVDEETRLRTQYHEDRALAWKVALTKPCPRCGVEKGAYCVNLTVRQRKGREQETSWPHEERRSREFEAAEKRGPF